MNVIVTGVTRSGNLGGTAMLCAVQDVIYGDVDDFALASILPKMDSSQAGPDKARIVSANYKIWLIFITPILLLFWPVRRLTFIRLFLGRLPILCDFSRADSVVDLSGIVFVVGRGIALLYYNVAIILPGLFFDIPVHKLSQAYGPFKTILNKWAGKWTLTKCTSVVARGKQSLEHLNQLGIQHALSYPDTSFSLEIPREIHITASEEIKKLNLKKHRRKLVVFSPSAVVNNLCTKQGRNLVNILSCCIAMLHKNNIDCALLPHSTDTGISKNDDLQITALISDLVYKSSGYKIQTLKPEGDPRYARALISNSDCFLACRFHSMIAALSQAVPVVTIGWSHKYREALAPFSMDSHSIDFSEINEKVIFDHITYLLEHSEVYNKTMLKTAVDIRQASQQGIKLVLGEHNE